MTTKFIRSHIKYSELYEIEFWIKNFGSVLDNVDTHYLKRYRVGEKEKEIELPSGRTLTILSNSNGVIHASLY